VILVNNLSFYDWGCYILLVDWPRPSSSLGAAIVELRGQLLA
jgi:hypothetical protein